MLSAEHKEPEDQERGNSTPDSPRQRLSMPQAAPEQPPQPSVQNPSTANPQTSQRPPPFFRRSLPPSHRSQNAYFHRPRPSGDPSQRSMIVPQMHHAFSDPLIAHNVRAFGNHMPGLQDGRNGFVMGPPPGFNFPSGMIGVRGGPPMFVTPHGFYVPAGPGPVVPPPGAVFCPYPPPNQFFPAHAQRMPQHQNQFHQQPFPHGPHPAFLNPAMFPPPFGFAAPPPGYPLPPPGYPMPGVYGGPQPAQVPLTQRPIYQNPDRGPPIANQNVSNAHQHPQPSVLPTAETSQPTPKDFPDNPQPEQEPPTEPSQSQSDIIPQNPQSSQAENTQNAHQNQPTEARQPDPGSTSQNPRPSPESPNKARRRKKDNAPQKPQSPQKSKTEEQKNNTPSTSSDQNAQSPTPPAPDPNGLPLPSYDELLNWSVMHDDNGLPINPYRKFSDLIEDISEVLLIKEQYPLPDYFVGCPKFTFPHPSPQTPVLIAGPGYEPFYDPLYVDELIQAQRRYMDELAQYESRLHNNPFFCKFVRVGHTKLTLLQEFAEYCATNVLLYADLELLLFLSPQALSPMTPPPTTVLPQGSPCRQNSPPTDNVMCPPRLPLAEDGSVGNLPNGDVAPASTTPPQPQKFHFADLLAASQSYETVNNFPPEAEVGGEHGKPNHCIAETSGTPGYPLTSAENPERSRTLPSGLKALHFLLDEQERQRLEAGRSSLPSWSTMQLSGGIANISPAVFELEYLTALYLSHNRITSLSKDVCRLVNLKILDISHNCLSYLPSSIASLRLAELYVQSNGLHAVPNEIGLMHTLVVFKAHDNPLAPEFAKFFDENQPVSSVIAFLRARLDSLPPRTERTISMINKDFSPKYPKFTALCYNILCRHYAGASHYPWCPAWALDWHYRRPLILQEIEQHDADVMAFQEMDGAEFSEIFLPRFEALGYGGVYYSKGRARSMGRERENVDGCAIFYKHHKFHLAESHGVDISVLPLESAYATPLTYFGNTPPTQRRDTPNTVMINRMMPRDNVGLVVVLEPKSGFYDEVRNHEDSTRQHSTALPMVVATTHFHWDPDHCDVKAIQALSLIKDIRNTVNKIVKAREVRSELVPVMILGDFNSLPKSAVTDYLGRNRVSRNHEEWKEFANIDLSRFACHFDNYDYHHTLKLSNVLEHRHLEYTNYTTKFTGTIDHVFVTDASIRAVRVLDPVPLSTLRQQRIEGFPNPNTPSDHIPLYLEFNLVDPNDVVQIVAERDIMEQNLIESHNTAFKKELARRLGCNAVM